MSQSVSFDRASEYYDKTRAFPPEVEAVVGQFLAQAGSFKPTDTLLEIGIGTGRIALPLAPHVGQIIGADISLQMMEQLQRKQSGEHIHLALADALLLPFPNKVFDAGVIVHVLHLVADAETVLREMARVLKPDAKLLHCGNRFPDKGSVELLSNVWGDTNTSGRITERYKRILALFEQLGWQITGKHAHEYTRYTTPRAYISHIEERTWSATWQMSDAEIADVIQRLHAKVDEHFGGNLDAEVDVQGAFEVIVFTPPAT
jgi:ubiquinone/menaquinone biosynthesis C-methylase UbiE